MGRRAVPRIDPELDLARHLCHSDDLPPVCDSNTLFGNDLPWEIEVGCGKGLFLRNVATQVPGTNFLGVEVARKYARTTAARLAKADLTNAKIVHGDAREVFAQHIPSASVQAVHVYFPDPWWKKRHHRRRLLMPDFVEHIERVLVPAGRLVLWTDVQEYFQLSCEVLANASRLVGPHPIAERHAEHSMDYHTHFERRMRLEGKPIYRGEFRKTSAGDRSMI